MVYQTLPNFETKFPNNELIKINTCQSIFVTQERQEKYDFIFSLFCFEDSNFNEKQQSDEILCSLRSKIFLYYAINERHELTGTLV